MDLIRLQTTAVGIDSLIEELLQFCLMNVMKQTNPQRDRQTWARMLHAFDHSLSMWRAFQHPQIADLISIFMLDYRIWERELSNRDPEFLRDWYVYVWGMMRGEDYNIAVILSRLGYYPEEIARMTEVELRKIPGIGKKRLARLRRFRPPARSFSTLAPSVLIHLYMTPAQLTLFQRYLTQWGLSIPTARYLALLDAEPEIVAVLDDEHLFALAGLEAAAEIKKQRRDLTVPDDPTDLEIILFSIEQVLLAAGEDYHLPFRHVRKAWQRPNIITLRWIDNHLNRAIHISILNAQRPYQLVVSTYCDDHGQDRLHAFAQIIGTGQIDDRMDAITLEEMVNVQIRRAINMLSSTTRANLQLVYDDFPPID